MQSLSPSLTPEAVRETRAAHPEWFPPHEFVVAMRIEPEISMPASFADVAQGIWQRFVDQHDVRRKGRDFHCSWFAAVVNFGNIGVFISTNMLLNHNKKTFVFAHVHKGTRDQDLAYQKYIVPSATDRCCDNPGCLMAGKNTMLKTCECKLVKYCTKGCQKQHLPAHKAAHKAALKAALKAACKADVERQ